MTSSLVEEEPKGCALGAPVYAFIQAACSGCAPCAATEGSENMNKKFIIAWIVIFIAWFLGSFVTHGVLLRSDYMQLITLFRTEDDAHRYFPVMILAHVILSGTFVWIYARGAEAKPWLLQGIRFGLAIALLTVVPSYMIYFVVQPMPGDVVVKQIVYGSVLMVLLGTIVAWLYRDSAVPLRAG
jgi:hypothetical protein